MTGVSPAGYFLFFVVWAVAAILVAYVWYAFIEERRFSGLVCSKVVAFVLGAISVLIVVQWNDATVASSVLNQHVYLVALACAAVAASVSFGLGLYRSRFATVARQASVAAMLLVIGIGIGSTDLAAWKLGDVFGRLVGALLVLQMLVLAPPIVRAARKPTVPRRGAAVPAATDQGG